MAEEAEWSHSENERFENAIAIHDLDAPGCWDRVAAAVGGGRTADDVRRHYDRLVDDIHGMEARGRAGSGSSSSSNNRGGEAGASNGGEKNGRRRPQT